MPEGTHSVWVRLLKDYPIEDLRKAFDHAMRYDGEWLSVDKIIKLLEPDPVGEALDQWQSIDQHSIRYVDGGKRLEDRFWNDRSVRALQQIGGIERVYDATAKNIDYVKRDFCEAYQRATVKQSVGLLSNSDVGKKLVGEQLKLGGSNGVD